MRFLIITNLVILCIFNITYIRAVLPIQKYANEDPKPAEGAIKSPQNQNVVQINLNTSHPITSNNKTISKNDKISKNELIKSSDKEENSLTKNTTNSAKNEKINDHIKVKTINDMESGAVLRGFLVIVVIGVIFIIYFAIKTYSGKNKSAVMVRKYGIRTRRSDIEMTPLPLDEDEDDETLFDMSNMNQK